MKYKTLFSIHIKHEYFGGNSTFTPEINQYLGIEPTPNCLQLLKQYRLMQRQKPGKWLVLSPVRGAEEKTFLPKKNLVFRFYLKVLNNYFFQFTDFEELSIAPIIKGNELLHYQTDGSLKRYEYFALDTFKIIHNEKTIIKDFFLQNRPIGGLTNQDFEVIGLEGNTPALTYDSILQKIHFKTKKSMSGQVFQVKYRAVPKQIPQVIGFIDVSISGNNPLFEANYPIGFQNKKETWQYYILGNSDFEGSKLTIENGWENGDATFEFEEAIEQTNGKIHNHLKAVFPSSKIFKIASKSPIPYRKKVKTDLKLKKKEELLIKNLPNPSPSNQGIEIINIQS